MVRDPQSLTSPTRSCGGAPGCCCILMTERGEALRGADRACDAAGVTADSREACPADLRIAEWAVGTGQREKEREGQA